MKTSIIPRASVIPQAGAGSAGGARGLAALGRRALLKQLAGLRHGTLTILEPDARHVFGHTDSAGDLAVTLAVRAPQFWADAAFGGTVGAAESYIQGHWQCDDLTGLVRLMVRNRQLLGRLDAGLALISAPVRSILHWLNRNTRGGSRRNIAAHYDLGNDFFRLLLDETMAYSCAIYPGPAASLCEAQLHKFDTICRTLDLRPGERLLEIGTGWGGLAIDAAR
ncbi:MAG TPA: class I SAM-dependent methyltransferase, partial [Candidatus Acidoferrales bacterium]|nr:class I SAM-dependent methyltransferase [Candidatus Acidoferrales bacterium]